MSTADDDQEKASGRFVTAARLAVTFFGESDPQRTCKQNVLDSLGSEIVLGVTIYADHVPGLSQETDGAGHRGRPTDKVSEVCQYFQSS